MNFMRGCSWAGQPWLVHLLSRSLEQSGDGNILDSVRCTFFSFLANIYHMGMTIHIVQSIAILMQITVKLEMIDLENCLLLHICIWHIALQWLFNNIANHALVSNLLIVYSLCQNNGNVTDVKSSGIDPDWKHIKNVRCKTHSVGSD